MREEDIHSRSRLAGYDPELLFKSRVLIVGAGAIGQNLALDLALAGLGEIAIVDFDSFEAHNATRSPLYPTVEEQEHWGRKKAKVVAYKLSSMMTARFPRVYYTVVPVQALGDLPILRADIVFSAVDNQNARAYLAERCHVVGRPLIEAGLLAESFNVALFGPSADDPCYRCQSPKKDGAYSCTLTALDLEARHVLPSIQNTAAVLAGLQAEVGIQWLHGDRSLLNRQIKGNIRAMTMEVLQLVRSPLCPGNHWSNSVYAPALLNVGGNDTVEYLLKMVKQEVGFAQVRFPAELVVYHYCAHCDNRVNAYVPEWKWLMKPLCSRCGGPFDLADKDANNSNMVGVYTDENEEDILSLTCNTVGLPSGTFCEIWPKEKREQIGERYLMRMKGSIDEIMQEVPIASAVS